MGAKLMTMQADESFGDPKDEGTVITSESGGELQQNIQELHESIIRQCYHKRRQNDLTITCRMPPELLVSIFSHVQVLDILGDHDPSYWILHDRTYIFSHICSHWREVALSTLTLWSIINIGDPPAWSLEMLQRSKTVPLSVLHAGRTVSKETYPVLMHILKSHLPRIKNLLLDSDEYWNEESSFSAYEYQAILHLLGQHDFLRMERLAIIAPPLMTMSWSELNNAVPRPDSIITQFSSLKRLRLVRYGINWELSPAFEGLKSFMTYRIPESSEPSVAQLLQFISRVPLLETVSIDSIHSHQEISPSNMKYVRMEYLKELFVSCESISIIVSFFDHLILPKNAIRTITVRFLLPHETFGTTALQALTQMLDNLVNGPVSHVAWGLWEIECGKHKPTQSEGGLPHTFKLNFWSHQPDDDSSEVVKIVSRSLRLDQLVCLTVNDDAPYDKDIWSLIGNLPQLEELEFRFYSWHFDKDESDTLGILEALYHCMKQRNRAKLPLKKLQFNHCDGYEDYIAPLKQVVYEVAWNRFQGLEPVDLPEFVELQDEVSVNPDSADKAAEREDPDVVHVQLQDHVESAITLSSDSALS
ncbi:hypothetical protein H0H92_004730 [Tricholoma furcatifolium]|nr:hypothetical protein H0H92_004730 [Tricholoma furcatifolium]